MYQQPIAVHYTGVIPEDKVQREISQLEARITALKLKRYAQQQQGDISQQVNAGPMELGDRLHSTTSFSPLHFEPAVLFLLGSPLSLFLTLRGASSKPGLAGA